MKKPTTVFCIMIIITMVAAPLAQSAPFTPRYWLAYKMAEEYWGGPPTNCTSVDSQIVPPESLNRLSDDGSQVYGQATVATFAAPCVLWIDRRVAARFDVLCVTMVHEVGHLRGQGHSTAPADVMYPTMNAVPPRCRWAGRAAERLQRRGLSRPRRAKLAQKFWSPLSR